MSVDHANGKLAAQPLISEAETSSGETTFEDRVIDYIKGDAFVVDWYGTDDPGHPQNLPSWRKWAITTSMACHVLSTTFASSVFSAATRVTSIEFSVNTEVMVLATSLFMVGFACGPIIFAYASSQSTKKKVGVDGIEQSTQ
jgi:MFS transporter, DHA1 family, multidrug resistance protein